MNVRESVRPVVMARLKSTIDDALCNVMLPPVEGGERPYNRAEVADELVEHITTTIIEAFIYGAGMGALYRIDELFHQCINIVTNDLQQATGNVPNQEGESQQPTPPPEGDGSSGQYL